MNILPSGTITFLYTDIEGSTPMWDRNPKAMQKSVERHNQILRQAIEEHGGTAYKIIGDAFQAAFVVPAEAVSAAVAAQQRLIKEDWGTSGPIQVRMGIHAGPAKASGMDYDAASSQTLNRVSRIMSAGHGGQILVSLTIEELTRGNLPPGVKLKDIGEHALRGLSQKEQLFQVVAPGLPEDFPPLATATRPQHNLPTEGTPFVGRADEITKLIALIEQPECRLVTILGQGGVGKSRLAVQVARKFINSFPDGVWFAPLAPLPSPEHIATTVASALNLPLSGQTDPADQVVNYLRSKKALIILDNYEHLLPDGVALPLELLKNAPEVKLLVTTRERLGLQEEWIFELAGLAYPKNGSVEDIEAYDAVNLFLQHARRVARFPFSEQEKSCIARLSQLVEGLPLAIVLAASWSNTLNCSSILSEIQRNLNFLESGLRDVPERHRSIQAVFEQSWKLLDREEQSVFKRLSVFRGGFEREAGEEIAVASLRTLAALVDKSLLYRDSEGRYQVHELLRQYADEKLEESADDANRIRDLHCEYYNHYLSERYPDLIDGGQIQALEEIDKELQNIRTAWQRAVERAKAKEIQKSAGSLFYYCQMRCLYQEGVEGAEGAVESMENLPASDVRDQALTEMLTYLGWLYIRLGKLNQARQVLDKSLNLYPKLSSSYLQMHHSDPNTAMSILEVTLGNYQMAAELSEQSLKNHAANEDQWNLILGHYALASAYLAQGKYEQARQSAQNAYSIAESRDERWLKAYILINLGDAARAQGDFKQAEEYYQSSYHLREEFGDRGGMATALNHLGEVAILEREYKLAEAYYQRSLEAYQGIGDRGGLATALNGLGQAAQCLEKIKEAKRYYHEALDIAVQIQYLPLANNILTNISLMFLESGEHRRGAEIISSILNHPATDQPTKERLWQILADYETEIPVEILKDAKKRDPEKNFAALVNSLQNELSLA
jgi:predicted ATPase/class 3 adenylate cyclase/Tfp pilus assembly protein PilF